MTTRFTQQPGSAVEKAALAESYRQQYEQALEQRREAFRKLEKLQQVRDAVTEKRVIIEKRKVEFETKAERARTVDDVLSLIHQDQVKRGLKP